MGSTVAVTDSFSSPNYLGELFVVGQNATPFLNMIGGLTGGKNANAFIYPISQEWGLDAGAQPAITETASLTAPAAKTYARSQKYNTCQIFHKAVTVSYAKSSQAGALSGINIEGSNQVRDEKTFQINANLKQIAKDVEHTFINGVYAAASSAAVAAKTRGMISAISTNFVHPAAPIALAESHISALVKTMADNGCPFTNPVMFAGSTLIQKLTALYLGKFMSDSRNVGGTAVKQIITDFCELGIVWAPAMPADSLAIIDMAYVSPVFLAVPGKGFLFYEELAKTGAAETGQIYGQIGLDHGVEQFHGKIDNLT